MPTPGDSAVTGPGPIAVVGAGEIGSGWAALFCAYGASVRVADPAPEARARVDHALTVARALGIGVSEPGSLTVGEDAVAAAEGAVWVQESLPERLDLKRELYRALAPAVGADCVVASSASTFTASALAEGLPFADRLVIAHPLHPVYAVPAVELCGGERTSGDTMLRAASVLRALGRDPIVLRAELPGLASNRLTAALLREAMDLVLRGAIDAKELDRLVARGLALGWAAAGPLRTEAIGAGPGGFAAFLDHLGDPLEELWRSLAGWDSLSPAERERLIASVPATAPRAPTGMGDAHEPVEGSWADRLLRIARAAAER